MSASLRSARIIIVGAGIAGLSLAAKLAERGVAALILEQYEGFPNGATGRSAALLARSYFGSPAIAVLTAASEIAYEAFGEDFADRPVLTPRGVIYTTNAAGVEGLKAQGEEMLAHGAPVHAMTAADIREAVPYLNPADGVFGVAEPGAKDIDVDLLAQGYARAARRGGAQIVLDAELNAATWDGARWTLETRAGAFEAEVLVNAAGAWADVVAARCGVAGKGLQPLRRTAMTVAAANPDDPRLVEDGPFVFTDGDGQELYWRYGRGQFLISPADETPSPPCDAQPEIEDVAMAMALFEERTDLTLAPTRPKAWAGLRTFAPDRAPVIGFAGGEAPFFWLAGQGGYGIQTADGAARLACGLLLDGAAPADLLAAGLDLAEVAPGRLPDMTES